MFATTVWPEVWHLHSWGRKLAKKMDFFLNEMHLCFHVWFQVLWWTLCNDYWKCTYDATIAFVLGNKQVLYDFVQNKCNIPYDVFIYRLYFFFVLVFVALYVEDEEQTECSADCVSCLWIIDQSLFKKKKKYCHKAFQSKLSLYQHLHLCWFQYNNVRALCSLHVWLPVLRCC